MQSLYGKFRLVTKQTVNTLKSIELSKASPLESRFSGCSMNRNSFKSERSFSGAAFLLNKEIGAKVFLPASSERCSIAPVLSSYRGLTSGNQSAPLVFHLPTRNFSTSGSAPESGSAAPDVPPPRIKFKRLDKTARHIMQIIDKEAVAEVKANREIPEIRPGYIIQMKVVVPENKRRTSIIKGVVIAMRNAGLHTTFRIRRLVGAIGIENLFPLYSPNIKEIKVLEKKKVRRAKLYYLRDKMSALKKH